MGSWPYCWAGRPVSPAGELKSLLGGAVASAGPWGTCRWGHTEPDLAYTGQLPWRLGPHLSPLWKGDSCFAPRVQMVTLEPAPATSLPPSPCELLLQNLPFCLPLLSWMLVGMLMGGHFYFILSSIWSIQYWKPIFA